MSTSNTDAISKPSKGKIKAPEPKMFQGTQSYMALKVPKVGELLVGLGALLHSMVVPKIERIPIASMYLDGDTKLWWRTT